MYARRKNKHFIFNWKIHFVPRKKTNIYTMCDWSMWDYSKSLPDKVAFEQADKQ